MTHDIDDVYIERLQTAWSKTYRKMQIEIMDHRQLGLTGPQFHLLKVIAKHVTCNVSFLAEMLDVKPSAVTVMTDRLVQSGYVERRHDTHDRRTVLLSVTEVGNEVFQQARKRSYEVLRSYLDELSEEEQDILLRVMERFANKDTI